MTSPLLWFAGLVVGIVVLFSFLLRSNGDESTWRDMPGDPIGGDGVPPHKSVRESEDSSPGGADGGGDAAD